MRSDTSGHSSGLRGMRGAPAVLWDGVKDPLGKVVGTELKPSPGGGHRAGDVLASPALSLQLPQPAECIHPAGNGQGQAVSASST